MTLTLTLPQITSVRSHRNGRGLGAESALCLHLALCPSLAEFLLWIHKRLSTRITKYHMAFTVQNSYQHEDLAFTGGRLKKMEMEVLIRARWDSHEQQLPH